MNSKFLVKQNPLAFVLFRVYIDQLGGPLKRKRPTSKVRIWKWRRMKNWMISLWFSVNIYTFLKKPEDGFKF